MSRERGMMGSVERDVFRVRWAGAQTTFCASLDEARRTIRRRAEHDSAPPNIVPVEIVRVDESVSGGLVVVEWYPND